MNGRDEILLFAMQLVSLEESLNELTKIFGKSAVLSLICEQSFHFVALSFHHNSQTYKIRAPVSNITLN